MAGFIRAIKGCHTVHSTTLADSLISILSIIRNQRGSLDDNAISETMSGITKQKWREEAMIPMHNEHKPGDTMFIDYTGQKMEITSDATGVKSTLQSFPAANIPTLRHH